MAYIMSIRSKRKRMNSIERIISTINFQQADRVPVIPQIFGHAAAISNIDLGDYVRDGALIADSQLKALDKYKYDAVFALMDVYVETEAVGSVLKYKPDRYPDIKSYAIIDDTDINSLPVPDPNTAGRMPELLKAIAALKDEVGKEVLVVGCVLGPMTLATVLAGIESVLYLTRDDAERFSRLLDYCTEVLIRFGLEQIRAGAHLPIVFDPSASPAVIPYRIFSSFELPRLKRIFDSFKKAGAAANWLHIAGPVDPILSLYPEAGVDIANIDYCVDFLDARKILPDTCLDGNIKPLSFVDGDPGDIASQSSRLLELSGDHGGFILSSGCEIPPESKPENISAMVNTVYGKG